MITDYKIEITMASLIAPPENKIAEHIEKMDYARIALNAFIAKHWELFEAAGDCMIGIKILKKKGP